MPRLVPPVVALVLFLGLGYMARHYFPQWLEGKLKESDAAMEKERANWKPVETNFSGVKFDATHLTPTFQPSWQTQGGPASKPVR
jgi:hypothetical protein